VEQLMALVRTPHRSAQVVTVISGAGELGASTTAAGMARILATVRDDYTALLSVDAGRVNAATIQEVSRGHAFVVVDLGARAGDAAPQALSVSTRIVVVTSADKHDAAATRVILDRVHQVKPMLVAGAVIAVVCKTGRQYRRVVRELSADRTPQATQIIPIPADPAVRNLEELDLTRLAQATREAYLRLAAVVAAPRPAAAGGPPPPPAVPPR
jgi:MinD-like ATPase involved in chromosome partitioning or flagellar assembly